MFHSTIYGNRIYTPRSSRASHIHRLSERFPFVAASPFKANGEAIRSLGACSRDLDGGRGPGAQYRPPAAMRPPFGIAPRSTPPQEGPTDAPDYDALANRVINRLPYRRWTRSLRPTTLG